MVSFNATPFCLQNPKGLNIKASFLPLMQAAHFASELVQNADDCRYSPEAEPAALFVLERGGTLLTVLNNERRAVQ
jgi:hypothetical protein